MHSWMLAVLLIAVLCAAAPLSSDSSGSGDDAFEDDLDDNTWQLWWPVFADVILSLNSE